MYSTHEVTPEVQALIDAGIEVKGFLIRMLAYLLDLVVLVLINYLAEAIFSVVIFLPLAALLEAGGRTYTVGSDLPLLARLSLALVLSILYTAAMEAAFGATVGKLLLGLRVVNYEGRLCSLGQALLRGVLRLADGLIFGAVAYLQMKSPLRQRLGDRVARTLVVSAKSSFIAERRPWWAFAVALLGYGAIAGLSTVLLALLVTLRIG